MELIGSLFLALVFVYSGFSNILHIKKLILVPEKSTSFKITITIGAAILFSFFIILGRAWYHYLLALVSVVSFISVRLTKGFTKDGIQNINYGIVAPYAQLYKWKDLKNVRIVYSDIIEVYVRVENDEFEMLFNLNDREKFENIISIMADNGVILELYR